MISHSASGRVGFWDGSSMSQLATLIRAATHYPPSMSQLATAIRAATHILETQLTVTSYKLYFGPHPIRVQRTTIMLGCFRFVNPRIEVKSQHACADAFLNEWKTDKSITLGWVIF